jgi:hypothetical protein
MNERIRAHDLWTQVCQEDMPELDETYMTMRRTRKFAELLIRECVGVVDANMDDILDQPVFNPTDEIWNRARVEELVRVALHIKKHFGVKE